MKSASKWKCFDFDEEHRENEPPPNKRIRLNENPSKPKQNISPVAHKTVDFLKEVQPKTVEDLMVHNKKIEQLQGWLNLIINKPIRHRAEFLLISGPTGCGKMSTLEVLCRTLDIEILEYINPVDLDYEVLQRPGQMARFMEFFEEGKYPSLVNPGRAKLLLLKDFPNAIIRSHREFPDILEEISIRAKTAVVFMCTDSNNSERDLQQLLFPEDIQLKFKITHVNFNSCAVTLMKKGLKRVIGILASYDMHSPALLDDIINSSMGDIRCALNQLLLNVMTENGIKPAKQKFKKTKISQFKAPLKDETLGLFHGLGRVLNPKRTPHENSWRLNCDVGKLVDEFSIQPNKFNSFLFENYIKYFGDFDEIQQASDVLSFSSRLLENWEQHDTLVMGLWISVLGLMVANEHRVSRWNQIKGPKKIDKSCIQGGVGRLHPMDQCYFDMINNSDKYHKFNV